MFAILGSALYALSRDHRGRSFLLILVLGMLGACGGGGGGSAAEQAPVAIPEPDETTVDPTPSALDTTLGELIEQAGLLGDASFNRTLPSIDSPLAQLGMQLFFSKSLGGEFDSACVSCHHPALGGGDGLSLPVGVGAMNPDLLGLGRIDADGAPDVPRNAPTVFNAGLWDAGMFWDSRVESFGKEAFANGSVSAIRTPDVAFGDLDPNADQNLPDAQARFPVTSVEEMRGGFAAGIENEGLRSHLAARIGDYGVGAGAIADGEWLVAFQRAFGSSENAETLITFDNIALALAEYQRSMIFTANPFGQYVDGSLDALSDQQKEGAILFFQTVQEGGGGCANCHSGDRFTDERHHVIAFPQIGPGKGDGDRDDFGRARETGLADDRYRFRTPTLLNVAETPPYGHAGAYETLDEVLQHYNNPRGAVNDFFDAGGVCQLPQFESLGDCDALYTEAAQNTELALDRLAAQRNAGTSLFEDPALNGAERAAIVAFLEALTDPCLADPTCYGQWIADPAESPDGHQLNAVNRNGDAL